MARYIWTQEHEKALLAWCSYLGTPASAVEAVRNKCKRLKLAPAEIVADLNGKIIRGVTKYTN